MNIVIIDDDIFVSGALKTILEAAVILPFPPQARTEKTQ